MNDLELDLRTALREAAADAGPPPAVPTGEASASRKRWRSSWLVWAPLTVVATAAVVIPVALMDRAADNASMTTGQVATWIDEICTQRPDGPSPSQSQLSTMDVVGAGVCEWQNPRTWKDIAVPITATAALGVQETEQLLRYLQDAETGTPDCVMIDSPPPAGYFVMLRDSAGRTWQVTVPKETCLGFQLNGQPYWSEDLVGWLKGVMVTESGALVEDLEDPSAVVHRARDLLGDRFVDVSISGDHSTFVVGVLDLTPDEAGDITAQLTGKAPIRVEPRSVSAAAVAELRRRIEGAVADWQIHPTVIGSNLADGSVLVGIRGQGEVNDAIDNLGLLGTWTVEELQNGTVRLVPPKLSEPAVVLRVIRLTDAGY